MSLFTYLLLCTQCSRVVFTTLRESHAACIFTLVHLCLFLLVLRTSDLTSISTCVNSLTYASC